MSMREKIAELVLGYDWDIGNSDDVAEEIIDALPDMIKPLEWERLSADNYVSGDYHAYHTGCLFGGELKYAWGYGPSVRYGAKTIEAAIKAANAHHAAAIMGAFE